MKFLDPTTDPMFKRLFANQAKKEIVISFLNSVLGREGQETIVDVVITDPHNNQETDQLKFSVVDARCTDQNGKQYIVEMQVDNEYNYAHRSQYYACLGITRQLEAVKNYKELMPVIFVGVLGFNLFKNNDAYLTIHQTLNVKTHERDLQLMEFCYIELQKFTKTIDQLDNVVDKWIYLLQNASKFDQIPVQLQKPAALEEAMTTLNQGSMTLKELAVYDKYLDARRVEQSVLETAQARGEAMGQAMGERQKALTIARQLLATGMAVEQVALIVGLAVEDIK